MPKKKHSELFLKKKSELLDFARKNGLKPGKSWTKQRIIEYIEQNLSAKKAPSSKDPAGADQFKNYLSQHQPGSVPPLTSQGDQMTDIEKAKYDTGVVETVDGKEEYPIPERYGEDCLTLLPRDPEWLFSYWEITEDTLKRVHKELGENFSRAKPTLRMHLLKDKTRSFFDVEIFLNANNWYVQVPESGVEYEAELGFKYGMAFHRVLKSNTVRTPSDCISEEIDERWMVVENLFQEIYGMAAAGMNPGSISSVPIKRQVSELLQQLVSSGEMVSGSPGKPKGWQAEKFPFSVDTELILYGRTESGAHVEVKGEPVKLREDGTFTLRFALPDGCFPLECKARSRNGKKEKNITVVVTRKTS